MITEKTKIGIDRQLGGTAAGQPGKIRLRNQGKQSGKRGHVFSVDGESPALDGVLELVELHRFDFRQPAEPAKLKQPDACGWLSSQRANVTPSDVHGHQGSSAGVGGIVKRSQFMIDPLNDPVFRRSMWRPFTPPAREPLASLAGRNPGTSLDDTVPPGCPGLCVPLSPLSPNDQLDPTPRACAHRRDQAEDSGPVTKSHSLSGALQGGLFHRLLERK
jgi:hypothetical protein